MFDLSDYEAGKKFDGDYPDALKKVQARLDRIQVAHIVHKKPAIIVFEGWDAAGKGGIIKRLTAEWDPRFFEVLPIAAPSAEEKARHYLWRFWTRLPANGTIHVFDRSWYGRVLVERVEGFAPEADWRRAYGEINDFEAQQADCGTTIVKLFVHITQAFQDKQFRQRLDDPWKRWKTGAEDYRNRAQRAAYLDAIQEMLARTHAPDAPWKVIDGNNRKAARIAALTAIADRLEANVSMTPPELDPDVEKMARAALKGGSDDDA
ncbi:polyphosphate kinase 2 family protein [Sphingomonas japonica]|uniref:Polyphosphate kinase 2 (PPK2 family) n=1 Tax=Sphingomonas japonica TaxID=511662 RepID=A0ABX0U6C1_9SPHN|nr:polyphosphate kinase [Sphingomonas japonica]NIJ24956.1 polyphosphate kinase 2 (PPK2 family) [Sphingomonas japonica]